LRLNLLSRAKINLSLDVAGVRADGYHEISSVMQSLALSDLITLETSPTDITLRVTGERVVTGGDNLAMRAARLLAAETGCRRGVDIILHKKIPVAAGLGGGSANAAAVLWGLNLLWESGLDTQCLSRLGASLGTDVPFCLVGGTSLATGRGDELTQLPPLPELGVLLLKQPYAVSTQAVYSAFDSLRDARRPSAREMAAALARRDRQGALRHCGNALESVTFGKHPELAVLKDELTEAGALCASMSGSGPTLFGLFETAAEAAAAAQFFKNRRFSCILTTTAATGVSIQQDYLT
jgi:4-diphosphocytidyl-2-C-methyl-D-erythritol kinase